MSPETAESIRQEAESAPPLSPEQAADLAAIFGGVPT